MTEISDDPLGAYLRRAAARRWRWGQHDCATFVADWVLDRTGVDGMATLRGRYATEDEARKLYWPFGLGLLVSDCSRDAGLERTMDPLRGDIAALKIGLDDETRCAIATDTGWVMAGNRKLTRVPRQVAWCMAWRVPRFG